MIWRTGSRARGVVAASLRHVRVSSTWATVGGLRGGWQRRALPNRIG